MSFVPYATKGEAILCDVDDCLRRAIGIWQEDANLCEKHSAMAKAYWSKANLPAPY